MRPSTTWTTKYQIGHIFLAHLSALGVSFVFLAAAFSALMTKSVFKEILSVAFILVYFGMIYSKAHKCATLDVKEYTATKPGFGKMIIGGLLVSLSYLAALLIYRFVWDNMSVDGVLTSFSAFLYSLFFWVYTVPYSGIMGLAHGEMMWYSKVLMLIVPPAATCLGYLAGLKGLSIMDKLSKFVYEKQDK